MAVNYKTIAKKLKFEGCSHNVHLENPQKFNKTVSDFLQ